MAKRRIAVLGGGMASLTTVYQLTSDADWESKYDITIYQLGWRLGGKGASGRNGSLIDGRTSQRIEEHGLHLWFGFYDNAFRLIQQCYEDNNRPLTKPLATWQQAFNGYNSVCLEEHVNGQWQHWNFDLPTNDLTPGDGGQVPKIEEYVVRVVELLNTWHKDFQTVKSEVVKGRIEDHRQSAHMDSIRSLLHGVVDEGAHIFADAGLFLLHGAMKAAKTFDHGLLKKLLHALRHWLETIATGLMVHDTALRRLFILLDFGITCIKGVIDDGVVDNGFDVINTVDFRDWLAKHGAASLTVQSAIVQGVYGLVFGGNNQYSFEAGTALRGLFRLGLTYRGHVYYRMLAGMGDVIFAPMFEVLQRRGVKFRFFHKVTNLGLAADGNSIETISMDVQATLKDPSVPYEPFVTVRDLPCWPAEPNFDQLNEGDALRSNHIDLESYYSTWQPVQQTDLHAGTDFDVVVLGISIGALPTITQEFTDPAWKAMLQHVIPISTIAYQLWLNCNMEEMGYPFADKGLPLLWSYQEPYDTWSDMSDLIVREAWPEGYIPQNIAYFCGPMPLKYANKILENAQSGNFGDPEFPDQQTQIAKDYASRYINELSAHIWPGLWKQGQQTFDYSRLIDLNDGTGTARWDAQFFRANIDPTELYVMSFTDSSKYRIKTDGTVYGNLFITGDWIDNGFNAGCIEATVMSGLQAARALSGVPLEIPGERDIG